MKTNALTRFLLSAAMAVGLMGFVYPNKPTTTLFPRTRLALYEDEWREKLNPMFSDEAQFQLDENFDGSLFELRNHLRSPETMARGHFGWEIEAVTALRGTAFKVVTCAPSAFPGSAGHGVDIMRCVERDPVFIPVTTVASTGADGSSGTGPGVANGLKRCLRATEGFRFCHPEKEGTYGRDEFSNPILIQGDTTGGAGSQFDSLIWFGENLGAAACSTGLNCEEFDMVTQSRDQADAAAMISIDNMNNMWFGYNTIWDSECNDSPVFRKCASDENKAFKCQADITGESLNIYYYRSSNHGNSGDDVLAWKCSSSTMHEVLIGPAQGGGEQMTCFILGWDGIDTSIYRSMCGDAGHRSPTINGRFELADYVVIGHRGRGIEPNGAQIRSANADKAMYGNIYSFYQQASKTTSTTARDIWFKIRAAQTCGNCLGTDLANEVDSGWVQIFTNSVAMDTVYNNGYSIDVTTDVTSFWANEEPAVCDISGNLAFGAPCTSSGSQVDTTEMKRSTAFNPSDLQAKALPADTLRQILIADQKIGDRFRFACDGTKVQEHNAFADTMFNMWTDQTYPSSIPSGSNVQSMRDWDARYPGPGDPDTFLPDTTGSTYTACAKNSNGVPTAMADAIVAKYGGVSDDVTWGNDSDLDSYQAWRELFAGTSTTEFNNPDGTESDPSPATFGVGRRVYLVPLTVVDTVGTCPSACVIRQRAAPAVMDFRALDSAAVIWNGAEALVITQDNILTATQIDSIVADSVCTEWGRCHGVQLKTMVIRE